MKREKELIEIFNMSKFSCFLLGSYRIPQRLFRFLLKGNTSFFNSFFCCSG